MLISSEKPVAVLYQAEPPPVKDGIIKPMKPGGYADSGADIAFTLRKAAIPVITPIQNPAATQVLDWVFPDTKNGIENALASGAQVLWLNTILFQSHPIQPYLEEGISVVGQDPEWVDRYDDKWETNELLRSSGLPLPTARILRTSEELKWLRQQDFPFPIVAKPIRGRGSAGVVLVPTLEKLHSTLESMLNAQEFGDAIMVETFLPGQEVTVTVMPPGTYKLGDKWVDRSAYWSLPPVKRFNHQAGIAPYNGTVAVAENSLVLDEKERKSLSIRVLMQQCEQAAALVKARAPIRIDCRQDASGVYVLFDLNMKPNMTGTGRPGRDDQTSLSAIAARSIGWNYQDFLLNMLNQQWRK